MRISANVAIGPDGPQTHDEIAGEVADVARHGLAGAWWPQLPPVEGTAAWDPLVSIAATAALAPGIELGVAVALAQLQHPLRLAAQALTVQAVSGNRLTLGLGVGHAPIVEGVYGVSHRSPVRDLARTLEVLVPALRGDPVPAGAAPAIVQVPGARPPSLLLAALGPRMLELAGRLADGTVTTWAGPRALATHVVPRLTAAAAAAGRPAPRVVANVLATVTADAEGARRRAAERFGLAGQLPSYRAMLDLDGRSGPADALVAGDEDEVASALAELVDAGATEVLVSVVGPPTDRARTLALLGELSRAARASRSDAPGR